MALSERTRTIAISVALHGVIVLVLLGLAGTKILIPAEETQTVEFEFLPPEPEVEIEIKPDPKPETTPIPTIKRPEVVPENTVIRKTRKARAFQPKAISETGSVDAPDNAEAIPMPTSPLVFGMTAAVGGGSGLTYESTTTGTMALPPPGPAGGGPGREFTPGASNVTVARDWQITSEAVPLNDRSFTPEYPPLAKRQGREAQIVVRIDINTSGQVVTAVAISGPEKHGFRESAVKYVRRLRFEPAKAGDNAVASRIEWTVHFYVRN